MLAIFAVGISYTLYYYQLEGAFYIPGFSFILVIPVLIMFYEYTEIDDFGLGVSVREKIIDIALATGLAFIVFSIPAMLAIGVVLVLNSYYWGISLIVISSSMCIYAYIKVNA